jgi:transcriptional regulator GlxA family with amidase domain
MEKPGHLTIERIAAECGFGAVSTFYAAFQRIRGGPPSAFRAKVRTAAGE